MFRHVYRIRGIHFTHMGCNAVVMVEDLNAVLGRTDVHFLTNELIGDRVLAIPDGYEMIGLYGGS